LSSDELHSSSRSFSSDSSCSSDSSSLASRHFLLGSRHQTPSPRVGADGRSSFPTALRGSASAFEERGAGLNAAVLML
jgi:hypothetical protein